MNLTIDTSAILAVLMNEQHKPHVIEQTKGHNLISPTSLDAEIGNALSSMIKRKRIALELANKVISTYEIIPIRRIPIRVKKSLQLSEEFSLYAYDSYMLDTALQLSTPILSLDKKMVGVARELGIETMEIEL